MVSSWIIGAFIPLQTLFAETLVCPQTSSNEKNRTTNWRKAYWVDYQMRWTLPLTCVPCYQTRGSIRSMSATARDLLKYSWPTSGYSGKELDLYLHCITRAGGLAQNATLNGYVRSTCFVKKKKTTCNDVNGLWSQVLALVWTRQLNVNLSEKRYKR